MSVNVGRLYRKSILRDLNGNIRDLRDETHGGYIIRNYQIVNQDRWDELVKIEEDKKKAAQAASHAVTPNQAVVEVRNEQPSKLQELEKRIDAQDAKLDAILAAVKK